MRVLFCGGKDVGCGCLEVLLACKNVDVVGVVVNPSDVDEARWYGSAARIALKNGIPLHCFDSIDSDYAMTTIRSLRPDLMVLVYYDQILRQDVLRIPPQGCVNLHLALAEHYRGCYPSTHALMNGEPYTGVTLHYVDEGIDTGDIIAEEVVLIDTQDSGRSLYYKLTEAGIALFKRTLPLLITGRVGRKPQVTTEWTKTYPREFPSQLIEFEGDGQDIYNHIRAVYFPPFPLPYFYLEGKKMVIVEEGACRT